MLTNRPPRKPDLFIVLVLIITMGMSVTLAYQYNLYHDKADMALAEQAPQPAAPARR